MKKKIFAAVAVILLIAGGLTLYFTRYMNDSEDTEALYRENIAAVAYENTVEEALPQTEIYILINDHFRSPLKEGKTVKKAILIGYDGCRADVLTEIQKDESAIAYLTEQGAALNLAYCGGVNYPEKNSQDTSTAPGWCSILTGTWADEHGITGNDITKTMDTKTLMTSLTEEGIIGSASFITKWAGHFDRENATYLAEKDYCETNSLPVDFIRCKNDNETFDYTCLTVSGDDCPDFIFTILEQTDSTGHSTGFSHNSPAYRKAFKEADLCAKEILGKITARETFAEEEWLFIITSDHGGIGTGHGDESIQERMTFVVADCF